MSYRGLNPPPFRRQDNGTNIRNNTTGSRLRPVSDPLEAVGFPSKGDKTHSHDLEAAWASLPASASADATKNPPSNLPALPIGKPSAKPAPRDDSAEDLIAKTESLSLSGKQTAEKQRPPAAELSTLLMSLRKLREGILATSSTTPVAFQQQIHIFSIRFSILARHPPSYFSSLRYLLDNLHTNSHPLSVHDLTDFTSYLILDYACRQNSLAPAYTLLVQAREKHGFKSPVVDQVLNALTHDNWISFWRIQKEVDGYVRAIMGWATDHMTKQALKAAGRTYLSVNANWLLRTSTGEQGWTWQRLADKEKLGWQLEGDSVIIRKPRAKT
uniref:Putative mannan endo-1,4-beta-mannosidase A n=1 Tax=Talaromyces marneffei PM1 TaxID=1077442 RepID=A0A093VCL1_TALMA